MSEDAKSHTAILLPAAQIELFTKDKDSVEAFMALEQDWRFARVKFVVREGDVDDATSFYGSNSAPHLVIIQTENIEDDFTDRLEALAGNLAEYTSAIVIGPVNDVNLYRQLIGMGVSDYLVKPIDTASLGDDIAATLIEQLGTGDSRLVAVMGAKGGLGVTSISEALAWGLSDKLEQKTFLLDAAGGWSTLSVGMNFEPSTTLGEAVRAASEGNEDALSRMVYKASDKLHVLSSGGDVMLDDAVDADGFEALLDYLMGLYPVVLIDLSASVSALKRTVIARAHQMIMVTDPTLPSVRAVRTLLHDIKELRGGNDDGEALNLEVVLNMQGIAEKFEVPKDQVEDALDRKVGAIIPFNPDLFIGTECEGMKLHEGKGGPEVIAKLLPLLKKVVSVPGDLQIEDTDKKSGLGGLLTKLKTK